MPRQRWSEQEELSASNDYTRRWGESNTETAVGTRGHTTNRASTRRWGGNNDGAFIKKKKMTMAIDDLVIGTCAYDAIVKKITYSKQLKIKHVDAAHLHILGLEEQANIRTNIILGRNRMTPYYQKNIKKGQKISINICSKNSKVINASMDGLTAVNEQTGVDQPTVQQGNLLGKRPEENEICHGFINAIRDFGCFVQLDGRHAGYFGLVKKRNILNAFVSDVHAVVERNQKVYVKVIEIKQNLLNGKPDYNFSIRAVNQQTGVEQSTETQQPQQQMQYQQRQQQPPPPQQQEQQQLLRIGGTKPTGSLETSEYEEAKILDRIKAVAASSISSAKAKLPEKPLYKRSSTKCCINFAIDGKQKCSEFIDVGECGWRHSDIRVNYYDTYVGIVDMVRGKNVFVNFGFTKDGAIPICHLQDGVLEQLKPGMVVHVQVCGIVNMKKNGRKPLIEFKLKGLVYESWLVYEHRLPMIVQPSPRKTTPLPYLYTFKSKRCCADFAIDRKSCSGLRCGQEHSYIHLSMKTTYIGIVAKNVKAGFFILLGFNKDGYISKTLQLNNFNDIQNLVCGDVVQVGISKIIFENNGSKPLIFLKLIKILYDTNWKDYVNRLPMIVKENKDNYKPLREKPITARRCKSDEGEHNGGSNSSNNNATTLLTTATTTTTTTTNVVNNNNNDNNNNTNKKRKLSDEYNKNNSTEEEQQKKQKIIAGDDGKMVNKVVNESSSINNNNNNNNNIPIDGYGNMDGSFNNNNNINNMMMEYDYNQDDVYDPGNEMSVFDQEVELESQKLQNQNITVESLFAEREIHLQEIKAYRLRVEDLELENERQGEELQKYEELKSNYDNLAEKLKHKREQFEKEKLYRKSKEKKLDDANKTIISLEGQLKTYKEINGVFTGGRRA